MPMPDLYRIHFPDAPVSLRTERGISRAIEAPVDFAAAAPAATPGVQKPSLISSYAGSIDEILFMWPDFVFGPDLREGYRSLLAALPFGTRFIVAHDVRFEAETRHLLSLTGHIANARLVPISDVSFSDWAEDAFVGLVDTHDSTRYLCEPFEFLRQGDSLVADAIEESVDLGATPSPLIFQGGNCLIGDDFWLLGSDYYFDTQRLLSGSRPPVELPGHPDNIRPDDIVRLFEKYLDAQRQIIFVGTQEGMPGFAVVAAQEGGSFFLDYAYGGVGYAQPIFHIDMFITLVGRQADGRFLILVGSPELGASVSGMPRSPYDLQDAYNEIADSFPADRFDVRRIPLAMVARRGSWFTLQTLKNDTASMPNGRSREEYEKAIRDFEQMGATDDSIIESRDWYHATWNNCLVQESATAGNHVYVPTFGHGEFRQLAAVDAWVEKFWAEELKFTPHMLGDFHPFARRQGVVHCIKKYVARGT